MTMDLKAKYGDLKPPELPAASKHSTLTLPRSNNTNNSLLSSSKLSEKGPTTGISSVPQVHYENSRAATVSHSSNTTNQHNSNREEGQQQHVNPYKAYLEQLKSASTSLQHQHQAPGHSAQGHQPTFGKHASSPSPYAQIIHNPYAKHNGNHGEGSGPNRAATVTYKHATILGAEPSGRHSNGNRNSTSGNHPHIQPQTHHEQPAPQGDSNVSGTSRDSDRATTADTYNRIEEAMETFQKHSVPPLDSMETMESYYYDDGSSIYTSDSDYSDLDSREPIYKPRLPKQSRKTSLDPRPLTDLPDSEQDATARFPKGYGHVACPYPRFSRARPPKQEKFEIHLGRDPEMLRVDREKLGGFEVQVVYNIYGATPPTSRPSTTGTTARNSTNTISANAYANYPPPLEFESRFESGNLRKATRVHDTHYILHIRPDLHTKGHTQWYLFRVRNMQKGLKYRFDVVNCYKRKSLYNSGLKPLMYSERREREDGVGWLRVGEDVGYYPNSPPEDNNNTTSSVKSSKTGLDKYTEEENGLYTLTFTIEFPYDSDTCYFAHCYPFSYTDLQEDIQSYKAHTTKSKLFRHTILARTPTGNNIDLLTITQPVNTPEELAQRKGIILLARVHPGESNGSWMMKGFLEWVLGDSEEAKEVRGKFVVKCVPMVNVDGVIVGNYRCNLAGLDLNRHYNRTTNPTHAAQKEIPELLALRSLLDRSFASREISLYLDFHGHNRKKGVFVYGCHTLPPFHPPPAPFIERVFPLMLGRLDPLFSFPLSRFAIQTSKKGTGRVFTRDTYGIVNTFTLEASFCGVDTEVNRAGTFLGMEELEGVGRSVGKCIWELGKKEGGLIGQIQSELESVGAGVEMESDEEDTTSNDEELIVPSPKLKKKKLSKRKGDPPLSSRPKEKLPDATSLKNLSSADTKRKPRKTSASRTGLKSASKSPLNPSTVRVTSTPAPSGSSFDSKPRASIPTAMIVPNVVLDIRGGNAQAAARILTRAVATAEFGVVCTSFKRRVGSVRLNRGGGAEVCREEVEGKVRGEKDRSVAVSDKVEEGGVVTGGRSEVLRIKASDEVSQICTSNLTSKPFGSSSVNPSSPAINPTSFKAPSHQVPSTKPSTRPNSSTPKSIPVQQNSNRPASPQSTKSTRPTSSKSTSGLRKRVGLSCSIELVET
ncbi:Cytosolic carboxypeptidase 2 [Chytridiales sp. JEL 0842]|nr:Cytosolic carboxypeptidase 2 [Chytridiales sp. JEL 0842]